MIATGFFALVVEVTCLREEDADRDDPSWVTICAWCGRHALGGRWKEDDEVVVHLSEPPRSSSICPRCFEKLAPGVPYPKGDRC